MEKSQKLKIQQEADLLNSQFLSGKVDHTELTKFDSLLGDFAKSSIPALQSLLTYLDSKYIS